MKTLAQPIPSLSPVLLDSADVDLWNRQFKKGMNSFIVSVPVPGMSKEDLSVHIEGRALVISAKEQAKIPENNGVLNRRDFKHSFVLPDGIDTNDIQAKCRHGLLTINIEKLKGKKRHTVVKVLGNEKGIGSTLRLNTLWETIKEKINVGKFVQTRQIRTS